MTVAEGQSSAMAPFRHSCAELAMRENDEQESPSCAGLDSGKAE
jgi:hypothetical protein